MPYQKLGQSKMPLFLEENQVSTIPRYSKEAFYDTYEPNERKPAERISQIRKFLFGLKKKILGKSPQMAPAMEEEKCLARSNGRGNCSEHCSGMKAGAGKPGNGRMRGMTARPVSMYDLPFHTSIGEKGTFLPS